MRLSAVQCGTVGGAMHLSVVQLDFLWCSGYVHGEVRLSVVQGTACCQVGLSGMQLN